MSKEIPFDRATIDEIEKEFGTPFYLYDEKTFRQRAKRLNRAFGSRFDFKEFYPVKATPNASILKLLNEEGLGLDVATMSELLLAQRCDIQGDDIMFSSNGTTSDDFMKIKELDGIINLDDISLIDTLVESTGEVPDLLSFRVNPGKLQKGNKIIGNPIESKFGLTIEQLIPAYKKALELGVTRFGIHTMVASNVLDRGHFVETVSVLMGILNDLYETLGIRVEFINIGGGFGLPYRPEEKELDIEKLSQEIDDVFKDKIDYRPKLYMEQGRWFAPSGFLIAKVVSKKEIYKNYLILDAGMADLMRPGMYGAYHHITPLVDKSKYEKKMIDVVGSLCENNDKFGIDMNFPDLNIGDKVAIHDVGSHGRSMGFNYNGKLRPAEILLKSDGSYKLIRGRETFDDYICNMVF